MSMAENMRKWAEQGTDRFREAYEEVIISIRDAANNKRLSTSHYFRGEDLARWVQPKLEAEGFTVTRNGANLDIEW